MTKKRNVIYGLYDNYGEDLEKMGTMDEIADYMGVTLATANYYASPSYLKRKYPKRQIHRVGTIKEEFPMVPYEEVDYELLYRVKITMDLTYQDLAEAMGMTKAQVQNRFRQMTRFNTDELARMEDILYLDEGGLRK